MLTKENFGKILSCEMEDISNAVAHLELCRAAPTPIEGQVRTFVVQTRGDYSIVLSLCTELPTIQEIAQNMRHGMEVDEETAVHFMVEFFNILCGRIVSTINRTTHASARFEIPRVTSSVPVWTNHSLELYYRHKQALILIQAEYDI